jgi:uncharacterized protein
MTIKQIIQSKIDILTDVNISLPMTEIENFCKQNHIRRLSLFGSVLRDDFTNESDVDILVEFEAGKTPGLRIVSLQDRLSLLLGREIDLRTAGDLSRYFRDEVLQQMKVIYEQN